MVQLGSGSMAASNWDTLAFNIDGPCTGRVENHRGVSIEIYKNFLYVHDPVAKQVPDADGHFGFVHDVVMSVNEGTFEYCGWQVVARRGPQEGVYVVAESHRFDNDLPDGTPFEDRYLDKRILVGCGVYGWEDPLSAYADELAAAGVPLDGTAEICTSYSSSKSGPDVILFPTDGPPRIVARDLRELDYVGVQPESVSFLQAMVDELHPERASNGWPKEVMRSIPWTSAIRANQGDIRYFSAGGDVDGTAPGEAPADTTLGRLVKTMFSADDGTE